MCSLTPLEHGSQQYGPQATRVEGNLQHLNLTSGLQPDLSLIYRQENPGIRDGYDQQLRSDDWDHPPSTPEAHRMPSAASQGAPNEGHDEHYEQANRGDGWENPHLDHGTSMGQAWWYMDIYGLSILSPTQNTLVIVIFTFPSRSWSSIQEARAKSETPSKLISEQSACKARDFWCSIGKSSLKSS